MHHHHTTTRSPHHRHPGFTLIELLVVIGIIALLLGITIPVVIGFRKSAKVSQTKAMLNALAAANDEFNMRIETTIDHTLVPNGGAGDRTIGYFLLQASQVDEVDNLIRSSTKSLLNDDLNDNGTPFESVNDAAIFDPWQIGDPNRLPIRYASKVDKSDTFTADDYLRAHPRPFFVSAGPDGLWGTVNVNNQPDADAADNIYSFDIDN